MRNSGLCLFGLSAMLWWGMARGETPLPKPPTQPVRFVPAPAADGFTAKTSGGVFGLDATGLARRGGNGELIRQHFVNSAFEPRLEGRSPTGALIYDYRGREASQWAQGLPVFAQLVVHDIYPGVDVVYGDDRGRLKRDIVVAPGADPTRIRMGFEGISGICLNAQGALSVESADGHLAEAQPFVYQIKDGRRQVVAGHYMIIGGSEVGFALGAYDQDLPLVIDPTLIATGLLGGSGGDSILGSYADENNYYFTGRTTSTDFPTLNPHQAAYAGDPDEIGDAFLAVYRKSDFQLVYATYFGGSGSDQANAVYVDEFGNAAIAGWTNSDDLPVLNAFQDTRGGLTDGFVARFNGVGALDWSTYFGGSADDQFADMDGNNFFDELTLVGFTNSPDYPLADAGDTTCGCSGGTGTDAVYTRLNFNGTVDVSTFLGGSAVGSNSSSDVALDVFVLGSTAYVTGWTESSNFPKEPFGQSYAGGKDAFFTQFGFDGQRDYSILLGGSGDDIGDGIAAFNLGEVFLTGSTTSDTDFPVTDNALQSTYGGGDSDAFIARINGDTSPRNRMTSYWGGSGADAGREIEFTRDDAQFLTVYTIAGVTDSPNFPTGSGGFSKVGALQGLDMFLLSAQTSGNNDVIITDGTTVGGPGNDGPFSLNADDSGGPFAVLVGGATSDPTGLGNSAGTPAGIGETGVFFIFCPDLDCILPAQPNLNVTILRDPDNQTTPGFPSTYTVTVTNLGDGTADQVNLDVTIPHARVLSTSPATETCTVSQQGFLASVNCNLGSLEPGASVDVSILHLALEQVLAQGEQPFTLALVSSSGVDADPSDNTVSYNLFPLEETPGGGIGSNVTGEISEGVTDPVSTNNGAFYFELPLINLGGPMPLAAGLIYRSDLPTLVDSVNLTRFWVRPFATMLPDISLNGQVFTAVQLPNGDIVNFVADGADWNRVSGSVDLGFATTTGNSVMVPYTLLEQDGWFYLTDPRFGRVYLFEQITGGALLRAVMNRNGYTHTYSYRNGDGNPPTAVSDGLGRQLNFNYESIGGSLGVYVSSITDQAGRSVSFTYEAVGADNGGQFTLRSVTDVMGGVTTFEYGGADLPDQELTAMVRPNGVATFRNTYDWVELNGFTARRVVSQEILENAGLGDGNPVSGFTYDPETNTVTYTNTEGGVFTYTSANHHGPNTTTTDGVGNIILYTFTDGVLTQVTDRDGNQTGVGIHQGSGMVDRLTNPLGGTTSLTVAQHDQTLTNPLNKGAFTTTFYDVTRVDYQDGTFESQTLDDRGNVLNQADRAGLLTAYLYDDNGLVVTCQNPEDGAINLVRDAAGNVVSLNNSDVGDIELTRDTAFRVTSVAFPDGSVLDLSWRDDDRLSTLNDRNGQTFEYEYDNNGQLTHRSNPDGGGTQFSYTIQGELESVTDPTGRTRRLLINPSNQIVGIDDGSGDVTRFLYNPAGQRTSVLRDGVGFNEGRSAEGRLTEISSSDGLDTAVLTRDGNGFVIQVQTPEQRNFGFQRDGDGRVTTKTSPGGGMFEIEVNENGEIVGINFNDQADISVTRNGLGQGTAYVDPAGNSLSRGFSDMGLQVSETDALGNTTSFEYDSAGQVIGILEPNGVQVNLGRSGSRIDTVDFIETGNVRGTPAMSLAFGYDARGNLTSAEGITLTYDAANRLTGWDRGGVTFSQTFDAAGRVATLTYPDPAMTVTFTYNARGQLSAVSDDLSGAAIQMTYDDKGRRTGMTRGNAVNHVATWSPDGFLTRIQEGPENGDDFLDLTYTFNADGFVTGESGVAPLDAAVFLSEGTRMLTFDAGSRITDPGYAFDALGRQTMDPQRGQLTWDAANRLTAVGGVTFSYDGLSLCTGRNDGQAVAWHPHPGLGGSSVLLEKSVVGKRGSRHRSYVFSPSGELLYGVDHGSGNDPFYYHFDRAGHTRAVTNGAGVMTASYAYAPFGALVGASAKRGGDSGLYKTRGRFGQADFGGGLVLNDRRVVDSILGRHVDAEVRPEKVDDCTAGVDDLNPFVADRNTPQDVIQSGGGVYNRGDLGLDAHTILDDRGKVRQDAGLAGIHGGGIQHGGGIYVDDIVIGIVERGEMVTNPVPQPNRGPDVEDLIVINAPVSLRNFGGSNAGLVRNALDVIHRAAVEATRGDAFKPAQVEDRLIQEGGGLYRPDDGGKIDLGRKSPGVDTADGLGGVIIGRDVIDPNKASSVPPRNILVGQDRISGEEN